jgi:hypothetical protein
LPGVEVNLVSNHSVPGADFGYRRIYRRIARQMRVAIVIEIVGRGERLLTVLSLMQVALLASRRLVSSTCQCMMTLIFGNVVGLRKSIRRRYFR